MRHGELVISGRLKDLIVLRGRNLYPQDVELAAERAHPALRAGGGAAFSVDERGEESVVVVHGRFDLAEGPPLRIRIFTRPDGERVLLLVLHHLVGDFCPRPSCTRRGPSRARPGRRRTIPWSRGCGWPATSTSWR